MAAPQRRPGTSVPTIPWASTGVKRLPTTPALVRNDAGRLPASRLPCAFSAGLQEIVDERHQLVDCRRSAADQPGRQDNVGELEHSLLERRLRAAEFEDWAKKPDTGQRYHNPQRQTDEKCTPLGARLVFQQLLLGLRLAALFRGSRLLLETGFPALAPCLDENFKRAFDEQGNDVEDSPTG